MVQITRLAQLRDQVLHHHRHLLGVHRLQHGEVLVAELDQLHLGPGGGVERESVALVTRQESHHEAGETDAWAGGELGQEVGGEVEVRAASVPDGLLGVEPAEEILQTGALLGHGWQGGGVTGGGQQSVRPPLQPGVWGGGGRPRPPAHNTGPG